MRPVYLQLFKQIGTICSWAMGYPKDIWDVFVPQLSHLMYISIDKYTQAHPCIFL